MAELQFCLRVFANRPTQMAEATDHLVKRLLIGRQRQPRRK